MSNLAWFLSIMCHRNVEQVTDNTQRQCSLSCIGYFKVLISTELTAGDETECRLLFSWCYIRYVRICIPSYLLIVNHSGPPSIWTHKNALVQYKYNFLLTYGFSIFKFGSIMLWVNPILQVSSYVYNHRWIKLLLI